MIKSKILLIDDDRMIYDLIARILKREGHQVEWAKNGMEALEKLSEETTLPDLVLCDITMPEMDGYQTLSAIRADARLQDLPVVMLTAHNQLKDLKWAKEMQTLGYIVKPFRSRELLEEITNYLEDQAPPSSDTLT